VSYREEPTKIVVHRHVEKNSACDVCGKVLHSLDGESKWAHENSYRHRAKGDWNEVNRMKAEAKKERDRYLASLKAKAKK
jgi:hypothetical protein